MGNIPLHPLVVHVPLVLAVFLPIVGAIVAWRWWSGRATVRAWWIVVAVAAVTAASALVALETGETEEERVEDVVRETPLERHEERATTFLWLSVGVCVVTLVPLVLPGERGHRALAVAGLVGTLAMAGAAIGVGHSGGSLVYEHGAAAAYAPAEQPGNEWVARFGDLNPSLDD